MTDSCWPAVVVFLLWMWLTSMPLAAFYLTAFTLIVIEEFIL